MLRDTDICRIPPQYKLLASQNHVSQYIDNLLSTMDPISKEETDNDIEVIEGNIVSFSILNYISFNIFTEFYFNVVPIRCFYLIFLPLFRIVLKKMKEIE